MVEITITLVVETRSTRSHFGDNYTAGIMVHAFTREVVVAPRKKAIKTSATFNKQLNGSNRNGHHRDKNINT